MTMQNSNHRQKHLAYHPGYDCLVNLAGSYDYLEMPYFLSQDLENEGTTVHPTPKEMLDAYVTPLFLEKAKLAGMPVPGYYISNGYFEPPVIVDPINPFMIRARIVHKTSRAESIAKSLTRNHTYAICCQEIPEGAEVHHFRSVLGWCNAVHFHDASRPIWEVFRIPLAKVRVIVLKNGDILYSDISQLPFEKLNKREIAYLAEHVQWVD